MRTALNPATIKAAMEAGMAAGAVMPNVREVHQGRRVAPRPPVPEATAATARAAARHHHRDPGAPPVTVDRFVVPGRDPYAGLAVLSAAGVAGHAHEVWGCFPSAAVVRPAALVDGRLGLPVGTLGPTTFPWVEWTVVHAAGPALAAELAGAAAAVTAGGPAPSYVDLVQLDRAESWISRPRADALPFDEDLAALLAVRANVDPARCLGVHRVLDWGVFGPPQQRSVMVEPTGLWVLGRADAGLRDARAALAGAAPLRCSPDDVEDLPVRVEVLDAALRAVSESRAWTDDPGRDTAYPDLPLDADELLTAYLEIVGVDPIDCYGVSTSVHQQQSAPVVVGDPERATVASVATVVYRDRDAYEDGRERFARWSREEAGTTFVDEREAVAALERWGNRALKAKNLDTMGLGTFRDQDVGQGQDVQFYPYCAGPTPRP